MKETREKLAQALWRIYRRPERPTSWSDGGNLPWDEPGFSERMLREHLDESHGAASRQPAERLQQINWLWSKLALMPGAQVLDVTCGPGLYAVELASRGCLVTGIDFSPASIAYARELVQKRGFSKQCNFVELDVRQMDYRSANFIGALFLYGQLSVFTIEEAKQLLEQIALALQPGGRLVVEILDQQQVDKNDSTWWFTDNTGLWGDGPFIHLGERFWLEELAISVERFHTLHLDSGEMDEIILCDQSYTVQEMTNMMMAAGFDSVDIYPAWDGLPLYDAGEWMVFVASK